MNSKTEQLTLIEKLKLANQVFFNVPKVGIKFTYLPYLKITKNQKQQGAVILLTTNENGPLKFKIRRYKYLPLVLLTLSAEKQLQLRLMELDKSSTFRNNFKVAICIWQTTFCEELGWQPRDPVLASIRNSSQPCKS